MYKWIVLGIGLIIGGYGIAQLPDYYRNQGTELERTKINSEIDIAVEKAKLETQLDNAKLKLTYEKNFNEWKTNYAEDFKRANANRNPTGMLFNADKICAGYNRGETKTSGAEGSNGTSTGIRLLPEETSKNLDQLTYEMELVAASLRVAQEAISKSSCMVVEGSEIKEKQ